MSLKCRLPSMFHHGLDRETAANPLRTRRATHQRWPAPARTARRVREPVFRVGMALRFMGNRLPRGCEAICEAPLVQHSTLNFHRHKDALVGSWRLNVER